MFRRFFVYLLSHSLSADWFPLFGSFQLKTYKTNAMSFSTHLPSNASENNTWYNSHSTRNVLARHNCSPENTPACRKIYFLHIQCSINMEKPFCINNKNWKTFLKYSTRTEMKFNTFGISADVWFTTWRFRQDFSATHQHFSQIISRGYSWAIFETYFYLSTSSARGF